MSKAKFFNLWDWREGQALLLEIYRITKFFPIEEKYNLVSQLRSTALSVPSNIAEGTGRGTRKELNRFLVIARGSVEEVLSHLYIVRSLSYLNNEEFEKISERYNKLVIAINNHISSIKDGADDDLLLKPTP